MKKIIFNFLLFILCIIDVNAKNLTDINQFLKKGENFIFVSDECIEFHEAIADREGILSIVVHDTWEKGINASC